MISPKQVERLEKRRNAAFQFAIQRQPIDQRVEVSRGIANEFAGFVCGLLFVQYYRGAQLLPIVTISEYWNAWQEWQA